MSDVVSDNPLLTLHSADDAGEWNKRAVRAEFHAGRMVLCAVGDEVSPIVVDAAIITSVILAVSTLPKGGALDRSFFCTVEAGSDLILEAVVELPMQSVLGSLRFSQDEGANRLNDAYRQFVQQFHEWLARHGSRTSFKAQQPRLDNPGLANALTYGITLGLPVLFGLYVFLDRHRLAMTLEWAFKPLTVLALVVCGLGSFFLAMTMRRRLTSGRENL